MNKNRWIVVAVALLGCLLLGLADDALAARARTKPPVPDFTQGGKKGDSHDWTLGPTGARGWMYGWGGHTNESRQILVTAVAKGSPADGVLAVGDVIRGVGGSLFNSDARIALAKAIGKAEASAGKGVLRLCRWRDGKTAEVTLSLPVLGSYSETAPYDCPKSKRIFELGCNAMAARGLDRINIPNSINALALLASGRDEYKPMLAKYARMVAEMKPEGFVSWHYGHAVLFLAEYAAATGDPAVMPGLRRQAKEIAAGMSAVGTWGHRFARPNGNCNGYGCMNLPGLGLALAVTVAREAGVREPAVDRAIAKSSGFLRWYVNKGAIPYGDHNPWPGHEDNGKCSAAAILFDLLGDREAAGFFGRMSTAAYDERERGHTGNFYNMLWALPGVSRCGPLATGAYMKEHAWYYDLARRWDGSFGYQGSPIGEEEHRKYTNWDSTGAYMLAYALPLKNLYVTGKKQCPAPPLDAAQVREVIAAGRDYFSARKGQGYQGRTVEQLLTGLSSWSPAVRKRSAQALARCEGDFVPRLLKMLAGDERNGRYGACEALACLGPRADAAGPKLRALLKQTDPWMQSLACNALPALGPKQREASLPDLLKVAATPNKADPRGVAQRAAHQALFAPYPGARGASSLLSDSLEGVDRELLYPAIRSALRNEDGAARGTVARIYPKLTQRDLAVLMPDILKAIRDLAPSNEMFGDGIRLAGLDLVSRLRIAEGMALCLHVIETDRWGSGKRFPGCMTYLARYGEHAKALLPGLRQLKRENQSKAEMIDKTIAAIEGGKGTPPVVTMKEFMAATSRMK
jgi:hypothetical protein